MRVKELKALLEQVCDECMVLVPSSDHSYRRADASATTAAFNGSDYYEWFDEESASEEEQPVPVLVIS